MCPMRSGVVAFGRGRVIKSDGHRYFFRDNMSVFHLIRGIRHITDLYSASLVRIFRLCDAVAEM